jgi:hypothetical protein
LSYKGNLREFAAILCALGIAGCDDSTAVTALESNRPFANPADFELACSRTSTVESASGLWHLSLDDGRGSLPVKIGPQDPAANNLWSDEDPPGGWIFGIPANRLLIDDGVLVRYQRLSTIGDFASWTFYGCETDDPDVMDATYVQCVVDDCEVYPGTALRARNIDDETASSLHVLGEYHGNSLSKPWQVDQISVNVRYRDGYAYVIRRDGLKIVDVSDPAAADQVGAAGVMRGNDIKLIERDDGVLFALTSSDAAGISVFNVSDPTDPVRVHQFGLLPDGPDSEIGVHTIFIEGTRLYITQQGVKVYDISDPSSPEFLGRFWVPADDAYLHDMYVEDSIAYLNYWGEGLVVVDLTDVDDPHTLGVFDGYAEYNTSHSNWVTRAGGRTVSVHGDERVGAHVRIVDVDPTSADFMEEIGSYQTQEAVSVHNIMAYENLAFVTYYQDGLRVLDLSDPTDPREVAHYRTYDADAPYYSHSSIFEGAIGVDYDPTTRTIYVVDTHRGLIMLHLDEELPTGGGCSANRGTEPLLGVLLAILIAALGRRRPRAGLGHR